MLNFDPVSLPESSEQLRPVIREFIAANLPAGHRRNSDFTSGHAPAFSAVLGAAGWLGMTIPKRYGGGGRGFFDRYVVTEELLAAGVPVGAHWISDRQTALQVRELGCGGDLQGLGDILPNHQEVVSDEIIR